MSNKVSDFLSRVVIHFPVRFESDTREAEWLRSIIEAVGYYDAETLQRAAQKIIDTRTDRRFPLPAEIRKVCEAIVADDRTQRLPVGEDARPMPFAAFRDKLADELLATVPGQSASREGWAGGFHMFVRQNGRAPDGNTKKSFKVLERDDDRGGLVWRTVWCSEVEFLRTSARKMEEAYGDCAQGGFPNAQALADLGETMIGKSQALARQALGESKL